MTEQTEAAAQIVVSVGNEEVVVADLQTRSEYDIERHYGSGSKVPSGYSVKMIEHGGSMRLKGNRLDLNELLFYQSEAEIPSGRDGQGKEVGDPKPATITVLHMNSTTDEYYEVLVTTRGFEFSEGETAETSYEWIAMGSSFD